MAQLESTKSKPQVQTLTSVRRVSPGADLLSPIDSSLSDSFNSAPTADVEEWIAKARESIEAFGEFIGAGGVEMTKNFLVDEDPENSGGSDDDAYEFALEDEDGETTPIEESHVKEQHGAGQNGVATAGAVSGQKRKSPNGAEKLVILPGEAAPFGLIASLALKVGKRRDSGEASPEDDDEVGVASGDFFRSMLVFIHVNIYCLLPFNSVYSDRSLPRFCKVSHVE